MSDRTSTPVGASPPPPSVPGVEDLQVIGRGGFGVVYRGHQPDLGRDVAVKVLSAAGADERAVQLWQREVSAMGRLSNHPNIVAAFSAGVTADGFPYLVMPYVGGGSLHDRINGHGPLAPADVARVGSRIAAGLAAAHAAGVLHRDVKPGNVLLSEYGEPQLTDFGIARLVDAATTTTGSVRATIGYAAPEVLGGETATPASDVYGLGATLHAALAGRAPFAGEEGESFAARIGRVMTQPPPDLRTLGVPPALAAVVATAMAKDPADRPQTAEEMGRRLEALTPAELAPAAATVATAPAPAPGADRRRMLLTAAAVLAVVVLAGVAAWALARGDDGSPDVAAPPSSATTSSEAPPSTEATTTSPPSTTDAPTSPPASLDEPTTTTTTTTTTTEATTTTAAPPAPTAAELRSAVTDYYALVDAGRLEQSYALLSPRYQAEEPFPGYRDFWEGIRSVAVQGQPSADAGDLRVDARLRFVDGEGRPSVEDVTFGFVQADDGRLLIDTYGSR